MRPSEHRHRGGRRRRRPAPGSAVTRPTPWPSSAAGASDRRVEDPLELLLDGRLLLGAELGPAGGEQLDAVVGEGVVGRRDDHGGDVPGGRQPGQGRGGQDPDVDHVGPLAGQPGGQGGLQHGARPAGVAADQEGGGGDGAGRWPARGRGPARGSARRWRHPGRRRCRTGCWTTGYRLEYWGALRAFFRPYFFDSFSRASRVRNPAFLSAAAQLRVELAQRPGDPQPEGTGLARHPAAVDGHVDVPRLGRCRSAAGARSRSSGGWPR